MPRLSRKDKIINAALALAEDTSWRDLKLSAIAKAAKLSLADVAEEFASKADILAAFMARTDAELLKKIEAEGEASELPRDRLFDVIMLRLELLEPHKAALRNIARDMRGNPQDLATTTGAALRSQTWMLAGAGIEDSGMQALLKTGGLAYLYARVFQTWLDEEDAGLSKTMAELDRRLRQGETLLERSGTPVAVANAVYQFAKAFMRNRGQRSGASKSEASTP